MKMLVVENVCKNFDGLQALSQVSLEVEVGERRVIIGPNGAGKTTLFHIISGILSPTSGVVYMSGKNINRIPMHRRIDLGLSQTFQLITLFKGLTVLENTLLAVQSFKRVKYTFYRILNSYKQALYQAEQFLKQWGLWDERDAKVYSLSYGDQRILDILLSVANNPRLLLLDEPSSGLSLAETNIVTSMIKGLARDITIMLIEHNMNVALDLADRVTVLHMGQVMAEGTAAEIKRDPQVKKIYLGKEKE